MPSTMCVLDLFAARHKDLVAAQEIGYERRREAIIKASSIKDLGAIASEHFDASLGIKKGKYASWIPGLPLPAMLSGKRRLTVDITPINIRFFEEAYGIDRDTFIEFVAAGVILPNIRNFDPEGSKQEKEASDFSAADDHDFLEKLFDRASNHIYFLATIRDKIFDPLFLDKRHNLRSCFGGADALASGEAAAAKLEDFSSDVAMAIFRGERPDRTAVRWHWAYIQASKRFLDSIDADIWTGISREFAAIKDVEAENKGVAYLILANRLRYAHLLISAPISASFGGVYNLLLETEARFLHAVRQGAKLANYDYMSDNLVDLIHGLQVGRLPHDWERQLPARYRQTLTHFGVQVYVRYNEDDHLTHYREKAHQQQLIEYVLDDDGLDASFARMALEVEAMHSKSVKPNEVAHLAAESNALNAQRGERLRRLTKIHQGIERPSPDLLSMRETPIYEADPSLIHFVAKMIKSVRDNATGMGGPDDVSRRTIWFPRTFRRPPR